MFVADGRESLRRGFRAGIYGEGNSLNAGLIEVKFFVSWRVAMGMAIFMGVQHKLFARRYVPELAPKTGRFPPIS